MKKKLPIFCEQALFNKSRMYIKRGLKAHIAKEKEEYILWASLSLELLGKSVLSKEIHPTLIADPLSYESLFAACNHPISTNVKTIAAKTLFERLKHVSKKFDTRCYQFCETTAIRRNAELHSGESPFSGIEFENWEQEFWVVADIILQMRNQNLEQWLGLQDSHLPNEIILKANQILKTNINQRIKECKIKFEGKSTSKKNKKDTLEHLSFFKNFDSKFDAYQKCKCVSCDQEGKLAGDLWGEEICEPIGIHASDIELVESTYKVEGFLCSHCGFHAFGNREITLAGFPEEFSSIDEVEREFEAEYGND